MPTLQARTRNCLAERLETLVREGEASAVELAAKAGMNRTTLFKWRSPKYPAPKSVAVLAALADTLGVSIDWLLGRTDDHSGGALPCREHAERQPVSASECVLASERAELARLHDELAKLRTKHAALQTERDEIKADRDELLNVLREGFHAPRAHPEPSKALPRPSKGPAARPEPVDDHEAVAARVAALKAAKVAKYASAGREGLSPEEMDAVLQGASS